MKAHHVDALLALVFVLSVRLPTPLEKAFGLVLWFTSVMSVLLYERMMERAMRRELRGK